MASWLVKKLGSGCSSCGPTTGSIAVVPYVQRPPGPGVYEPTAPAPPLGTRMPGVLPLALEYASQFRPHGPPALRSGEYTHDFNEVKYARGVLTAACGARSRPLWRGSGPTMTFLNGTATCCGSPMPAA